MSDQIKKQIAHISSVGAEDEQSVKNSNHIIADDEKRIKSDFQNEGASDHEAHLLNTKNLTEILDETFEPQKPLIENFLYRGMYLFVGSPKVGKSFLMAQLGYHVSTGTPMWGMGVNKGTVLYLALEDSFARIQKRLARMFEMGESEKLFFAIEADMINEG